MVRSVPGLGDSGQSRIERRVLLGEDVEEGGRLGDEHARVPAVASGIHILTSRARLRLLRECQRPPGRGCAVEPEQLTGLDITVGGGRIAGHDADGDDVTGLRGSDGLVDDETEFVDVRDRMVGGERTDDGVGVLAGDDQGRQSDGGGRVLRGRFGDDLGASDMRQLLGDLVEVTLTGDDPDPVFADDRRDPVPGGLDEAAAEAEDIVEELRRRPARQRPQARSGSAGGDDGVEVRVHDFSVSEFGHTFPEVARRVG